MFSYPEQNAADIQEMLDLTQKNKQKYGGYTEM